MKKVLTMMLGVACALLCVTPVFAEDDAMITETKRNNIVNNCDEIHEKLVNLQHIDSRTRVYLGRYYEVILTDYVTPLNVWLVGHSKSNAGLVNNQNDFTSVRSSFVSDYIAYQKELENLVAMDCKVEPERFYEELVEVREKRGAVEKDVKKMRALMNEQVKLVTDLKEKI